MKHINTNLRNKHIEAFELRVISRTIAPKPIPFEIDRSNQIGSQMSRPSKMWPWELKPKELNTLSWFYRGPHLFVALYCFHKASFWGLDIQIGPNSPIYPKGFMVNFLNFQLHLQDKILEKW